MKIKHFLTAAVAVVAFAFSVRAVSAAEAVPLSLTIQSPDNSEALKDNSYDTVASFKSGDEITVQSETPMSGVYLKWNSPVSAYTVNCNGRTYNGGQYGFLHEYIKFDAPAAECTITLTADMQMCDILAYSEGELPADVQLWEPPCEGKADVLVFSTHADDEILFMGGVLATYGGQQKNNIQVAYMTTYWDGARIREHEKLDGIWHTGVRIYPVNSSFPDLYADSLESAMGVYNYSEILCYITEQIRRFKPMVCVTQDLNGEYGHGGHMILAKAVCEAVDNSAKDTFEPASAAKYGVYEVPKTYLHLYPENVLTMDLRQPLSALGGKTALEIATEAYKKHVSQQWCWFYVSDENEYSCSKFGLYKTTVGSDTGSNMLEHITTYKEIEAKEEESRRAAEAESESIRQSEEASVSEAESLSKAAAEKESDTPKKDNGTIKVLIIIAAVLVIVLLMLLLFSLSKRRKRGV